MGEFKVGSVSITGEDLGGSYEVNGKVFTSGRLRTYWLAQVKAYLAFLVLWEFNWSQDFKVTLE